jgi:hypothetical protein
MTTTCQRLISLQETTYYHCISHCVRRAWLCGKDPYNGSSFEHRRQWVLDRLRELSDIFSIKICAYGILSNHYHVVQHVSVDQASEWSDVEVAQRYLHSGANPSLAEQAFHQQKQNISDVYADFGIEFSLQDCLELVDWIGRAIRDDKKGSVPNELLPIM